MKIGVVSDTHSRDLPKEMLIGLSKMDLIIHAGDFCSLKDYHVFTKLKETKAVWGNMDDPDVRKALPRKQVLKYDGVTIGLFHGEGAARRLIEVMQREFKDVQVNVVIFGHSHQPLNEKINGVLYFNPGSPNDTIFAPYCSFGVLDIHKGEVNAKIIKLGS